MNLTQCVSSLCNISHQAQALRMKCSAQHYLSSSGRPPEAMQAPLSLTS